MIFHQYFSWPFPSVEVQKHSLAQTAPKDSCTVPALGWVGDAGANRLPLCGREVFHIIEKWTSACVVSRTARPTTILWSNSPVPTSPPTATLPRTPPACASSRSISQTPWIPSEDRRKIVGQWSSICSRDSTYLSINSPKLKGRARVPQYLCRHSASSTSEVVSLFDQPADLSLGGTAAQAGGVVRHLLPEGGNTQPGHEVRTAQSAAKQGVAGGAGVDGANQAGSRPEDAGNG